MGRGSLGCQRGSVQMAASGVQSASARHEIYPEMDGRECPSFPDATFGQRGESERFPGTPSTGRSWLGTFVNAPEVEFWGCNAMESPPRSGAKQGPVTHRMTISKPSCMKWRSLVRTSEIRWRRMVVMDMQSTRL